MNTTPNNRRAWRDYDTRRPSPLRDFALSTLALAAVLIPAWLALVIIGAFWS